MSLGVLVAIVAIPPAFSQKISPAEAANLQKQIQNEEVAAQVNALRVIVQAGQGIDDAGNPWPVNCNRANAVTSVARMAPRTYLQLPDPRITTPEQLELISNLITRASEMIAVAKMVEEQNNCQQKVNDKCCDNTDPIEDKCIESDDLECHAPRSVCSSTSDPCPQD